MPPVPPTPKPPSTTFVVERHVRAPRALTWTVAVEELTSASPLLPGTTEQILSDEAPWRRVTDARGTPFALYQLTLALQDHGPESHFVFGAFIELASADDPQTEAVHTAELATAAVADRIVAGAEAQATVGSTRS